MRRALLGLSVLAVWLVGTSVLTESASAHISVCRSDPVVFLTDGTRIDLVVDVSDASADLRTVSYALHAPRGMSVSHVVYTSGMASKETLAFVADQPTNRYTATVTVNLTSSQSVPITFTGTVRPPESGSPLSGQRSGTTPGPISISF
jgi:hypothetical protein